MVSDLGLNETIEFIDKQNDVRQFLAAANLYVGSAEKLKFLYL